MKDDGDAAYDRAKDDHLTGDCGGIGKGCSWCRQEANKRTTERLREQLIAATRKRDEAKRAELLATGTKAKRDAATEFKRWSLEVRRLESFI